MENTRRYVRTAPFPVLNFYCISQHQTGTEKTKKNKMEPQITLNILSYLPLKKVQNRYYIIDKGGVCGAAVEYIFCDYLAYYFF